MKKMKKVFAGFLAAAMMLSLSVTAFAAGTTTPTYTDQSTVTLTKVYKLVGNGSSPAETFTLEQVGSGRVTDGDAESAPALGTITGASFEAGAASTTGATGTISISLPTYTTVGVYEYTLREVNTAATAGVTYRSETIKLVVTVMQGTDGKIRVAGVHTEDANGTKSSSIENTYSAGTLSVSKTVDGNMGDHDKYFTFTVELTGETGKNYGASYAVSGGTNANNPTSVSIGQKTTFYLKDGETISIANLPYGVQYEVTENDYTDDGYTTTKTSDTGSIGSASVTATFTNTKTGNVDTGITMDSLPYIVALALVLGFAVVMIARRRRIED